jgi:hypothetical protein
VDATALQLDPALIRSAGPWVCALLVDRKQDSMQVQVGSAAVYVPANVVIPKVTEDSTRPGWPAPCRTVKAAAR